MTASSLMSVLFTYGVLLPTNVFKLHSVVFLIVGVYFVFYTQILTVKYIIFVFIPLLIHTLVRTFYFCSACMVTMNDVLTFDLSDHSGGSVFGHMCNHPQLYSMWSWFECLLVSCIRCAPPFVTIQSEEEQCARNVTCIWCNKSTYSHMSPQCASVLFLF